MFNQIITGINTALVSIPGVPALYKENESAKPALLDHWMRTTILPSEPVQVTSGLNRTLSFTGIIQLDYFTPPNTGSAPAMVDTIVNYFNDKDNRFITVDGQEIMVTWCWRGTANTETKWYKTPIFIRYQAYGN